MYRTIIFAKIKIRISFENAIVKKFCFERNSEHKEREINAKNHDFR